MHQRKEALKTSVLRRVLIYGVLFFLLSVLQCSFFSVLRPLNSIPHLALGALCGICLLDTKESAAICAIGSGFLVDALGSTGLSLSPLLFLIIALFCSAIGKKMLPNFLSWVVLLVMGSILGSLGTLIHVLQLTHTLSLVSLLRTVLLPEFFCTVLFSLPLYPLLRFCVSIADSKNHFRL